MFCDGDSLGDDEPSHRPRQLVVGLALQCSGPRPPPGGPQEGGVELSGDDAESSVLAAFQLVQSGWGQPGLPGWGSVVDNTEMKGPIDLEELMFPPAPPFGGKCGEYASPNSPRLGALDNQFKLLFSKAQIGAFFTKEQSTSLGILNCKSCSRDSIMLDACIAYIPNTPKLSST